jgi:hypothetical protein
MSETMDAGQGVTVTHLSDFDSVVYVDGKPVERFSGSEVAWSDAERYAGDLALARQIGRIWKGNGKG